LLVVFKLVVRMRNVIADDFITIPARDFEHP
jgi:hypothetical protein